MIKRDIDSPGNHESPQAVFTSRHVLVVYQSQLFQNCPIPEFSMSDWGLNWREFGVNYKILERMFFTPSDQLHHRQPPAETNKAVVARLRFLKAMNTRGSVGFCFLTEFSLFRRTSLPRCSEQLRKKSLGFFVCVNSPACARICPTTQQQKEKISRPIWRLSAIK